MGQRRPWIPSAARQVAPKAAMPHLLPAGSRDASRSACFAVPCETTAAIHKPVEKPNEGRRNSGGWEGLCLAGSAGE